MKKTKELTDRQFVKRWFLWGFLWVIPWSVLNGLADAWLSLLSAEAAWFGFLVWVVLFIGATLLMIRKDYL